MVDIYITRLLASPDVCSLRLGIPPSGVEKDRLISYIGHAYQGAHQFDDCNASGLISRVENPMQKIDQRYITHSNGDKNTSPGYKTKMLEGS